MLGIQYQAEISGLKGAYNQFCEEVEGALNTVHISLVAEKADFYNVIMTKENTAIKLAATSLAGKLVSRKMLYLRHNQNEGERWQQDCAGRNPRCTTRIGEGISYPR